MPPRSVSPHSHPEVVLPEPFLPPEPHPLPAALPPLEDEEEKDEACEDYPEAALNHPFPQPCSLQKTVVENLIPGHQYLFIKKENSALSIRGFFDNIHGDEYHWTLFMGGSTVGSGAVYNHEQLNALLQNNYTFQISGTNSPPATLESPAEAEVGSSYIFIPNENPGRIKLMNYLGRNPQDKFKWKWCHHTEVHVPQECLFEPPLMAAIVGESRIYKVSWPAHQATMVI